jgi:hypothetical protein
MDRQTGDLISLLSFFESRLKMLLKPTTANRDTNYSAMNNIMHKIYGVAFA